MEPLIQDCRARRQRLMGLLPEATMVIVKAAPVVQRTYSAEYPYRQDNDFYYLTGFPESDAALVLTRDKAVLFCKPKDRDKEIWNGRIIGPEQAASQFGMDDARPIAELDAYLATHGSQMRALLKRNQPAQSLATESTLWIDRQLDMLRVLKSPYEIDCMRKAASISAKAHAKAVSTVKPGMNESQLAAFYNFEFMYHGGTGIAYESIVGGGDNANILHYRENNATLEDGTLVLVDAGCEYSGYASDITRTFPVGKRFTSRQRDVYNGVLDAQLYGIELIQPGARWQDIQDKVKNKVEDNLKQIGLLKDGKTVRDYYMHNAGHWLGLDVHDAGPYKDELGESIVLEPNMVMTMEPGMYQIDGIGVRIEDDVLVTDKGREVLSHEAPKTIDEIEARKH